MPDEKTLEKIAPNEADTIDKLVELTTRLQDLRTNHPAQDGNVMRGVHAKSHGCLEAEFTVLPDLPADLRVGLLAHPGATHRALIRYSNADVLVEDDLEADDGGERKNGSRGMALKIFDVDGEILVPDGSGNNQDFLMINTPQFAFANARDYLRLNQLLAISDHGHDPKPYFIPLELQKLGEPKEGESKEVTLMRAKLQAVMDNHPAFEDFGAADIASTVASIKAVVAIQARTVRNPTEIAYFGAAPFRFGSDRVMKVSVVPSGGAVDQAAFENKTPDNPLPNYLREAVGESVSCKGEICLDFKVNVQSNDAPGLNIEDATTIWPDEEKGYKTVAKLVISTPQAQKPQADEECEPLSFNPWHALAEHQPVGSINRLRREVYATSAAHRCAMGY